MIDSSLHDALAGHGFLTGQPEGAVGLVAECARWVTFETGQFLLKEGEVADTLHLVFSGLVVIEVHQPGGESLSIETVGPGHVVGLSWISPPYRWHFDARALEPVTTAAIDSECLRTQLGRNPAVGFAILDRLASTLVERLQATRIRLLDLHGLGDDHPH